MAADAWVAITDHLGTGTGGAGFHVGLGRDSQPRCSLTRRTYRVSGLMTEFQNYLAELGDPTKAELRKNFRKKMDFISRA